MKENIMVSSGSLYTYDVEKFFEIAEKAGYKGVELCLDGRKKYHNFEYLNSLSNEYDLKIIGVHYMMDFFGVWGKYKNRINRSIKMAKELNAEYLVVHSWEYDDKDYNEWILNNQDKITEKAKPVTVVFENSTKSFLKKNPEKPMATCYTPEYMSQFKNVLMDTSHAATAEEDILKFYKKLEDKIKYIHFSDNDFRPRKNRPNSIDDTHLAPGKGLLPLKRFLKELKKSNYKGIISIELYPILNEIHKDEKEALKVLKESREFVERYLL